jgi:hypothetical protein
MDEVAALASPRYPQIIIKVQPLHIARGCIIPEWQGYPAGKTESLITSSNAFAANLEWSQSGAKTLVIAAIKWNQGYQRQADEHTYGGDKKAKESPPWQIAAFSGNSYDSAL